MSDQKKDNIREDQMAEFRELYRRIGINTAVSFVLDGTIFTVDRVEESYDGVHYPLYVYDAGAQILANAMDWLLLERNDELPFHAPSLGSLGNPFLGLVMMFFVVVGLFAFDGFLGLSYMVSWFIPKVAPFRLHQETFPALHSRAGLPAIPQNSTGMEMAFRQPSEHHHWSDAEDESEQLLN
jgi:hypothetical protein